MINKLFLFYKRNFGLFFILTISGLICLAWSNRFIQDDAFISLRYADNFVNGKGLVWNEGERIEGYTNFLWTLAMTTPLYLKFDPITFSFALSIGFFIFSLVFTYKISMLIFNSRDISLLTIILLGTNYTFSSYATGGLETQLQACIFVTSMFTLLRSIHTNKWKPCTMLILSLLLSAAILTRLDSALLLIVILPVALLFFLLDDRIPAQEKVIRIITLVLPFMVLVGAWLIWKLSYYGDILPNTFYVKASSITSPKRGMYYLYIFLFSYWLIPFVFFFTLSLKTLIDKSNFKLLIISLVILLWSLYVIKVGGDFMEFRFIVPILPLGVTLITWLIFAFGHQKKTQTALIALVMLGSLHHTLTFGKFTYTNRIETVQQLHGHIQSQESNWCQIGRVLGEAFNYDPDIVIATKAAGAIPYYSRLRTIDMMGLNDRWVARYGEIGGPKPGHQRRATLRYLLERKVNLVISHPWMRRNSKGHKGRYFTSDLSRFDLRIKKPDRIPPNSKIIEIPIDQEYRLVVLYLTRSPIVDEAVQRNKWNIYPILQD
ncbi:MAG: hypothetical protein ACFFCW_07665 [Candidatus Hodarchaeota archaeon]